MPLIRLPLLGPGEMDRLLLKICSHIARPDITYSGPGNPLVHFKEAGAKCSLSW